MTTHYPVLVSDGPARPVYDDSDIDPVACRRLWCARVLAELHVASPVSTMTGRTDLKGRKCQFERERALSWLQGRECRAIFDMLGLEHDAFCERLAQGVPYIRGISLGNVTNARKGRGAAVAVARISLGQGAE